MSFSAQWSNYLAHNRSYFHKTRDIVFELDLNLNTQILMRDLRSYV